MGRRTLVRALAVGGAGVALAACGDSSGKSGGASNTAGSATPAAGNSTAAPSGSGASASAGAQINPQGADKVVIEKFPLNYPVTGTPRQGGRLTFASNYDLAGLDPTQSLAGGVIQHANLAYNRLLQFKTGPDWNPLAFPGDISADLSTKWEQPDDKTYVFQLAQNAKWQNVAPLNGRPFVAEDVVYAYQKYKAGGAATYYMRFVDTVEAVDRSTVRIRMKEPYADQLPYFASRYMTIFPRELAESGELNTKAIGTGPMILKEARKGERMVWDRNPDYFGGGVPLDGVTFQIIASEPTRIQLLKAHQADAAPTTFTNIDSVRELVKSNPDAQGTRADPLSGRINFAFQLRKSPWNDVRMRRAVGMGLDIRTWGDLTYGKGLWYVGPNIPWSNVMDKEPSFEDLGKWYQHDLGEAKKLVQAAGGQGADVEVFYYPYRTDYDDFADLAVKDLKALGLNPKVQKVDYTTFNAQWLPGTFNAVAFGWKAIPVAPDDIFSGYYRSDSDLNRWGVKDAKVDELVDKQRRTTNASDRKQIWKQIWDMDLDQMWYVDLPDTIQFNVMQPWVQGLRFGWIQTNVTDAYDIGPQLTHTWINPH